jgi:hypothetical protein
MVNSENNQAAMTLPSMHEDRRVPGNRPKILKLSPSSTSGQQVQWKPVMDSQDMQSLYDKRMVTSGKSSQTHGDNCP